MNQSSDELDHGLQRLFAQSISALPEEGFLGQLLTNLENQRAARRWRRRFIWAACAALLVCVSPTVISSTLKCSEWMTAAMTTSWAWALSLPVGLWAVQRRRSRA